jgi:uncharacterized protein (TIGR02466 family)
VDREPGIASEAFDLFPTPFRRMKGLLGNQLVADLVQRYAARARQPNARSDRLLHSEPIAPDDDLLFQQTSEVVLPHVAAFGELLLGEPLTWTIKEMWVNVLESGGRQSLHNHANSFVSGVIYLTPSHPSANTVFVKALGGSDFVFNNTNSRTRLGPYNADKWVSPHPSPGDLVLFPSYLLHEVPANRGGRRVSLAFNAIPDRLESWGYTVHLSR